MFAAVPGFDPARVVFTPNFAPISEYEAAFSLGVNVTVDNVETLVDFMEQFVKTNG